MKQQATPEDVRFLSAHEVIKATSLCRASIYALMKANDFPPSIKIAGKRVAWVSTDIAEWQRKRIAASRGRAA
jgi:prophage regulatory protein